MGKHSYKFLWKLEGSKGILNKHYLGHVVCIYIINSLATELATTGSYLSLTMRADSREEKPLKYLSCKSESLKYLNLYYSTSKKNNSLDRATSDCKKPKILSIPPKVKLMMMMFRSLSYFHAIMAKPVLMKSVTQKD